MARRGRGEGSVYKRPDGLWAAQVTVGYDGRGKRRRRTVYGRTKAEVLRKLVDLQHEALTGALTEPNRLTVAVFLASWLQDVARARVRPSTLARYSGLVQKHVAPYIGGLQLRKVTPLVLQRLYSQLEKDGASPRTRELVHVVLHAAFKHARRVNLLRENPADLVDKPRAPKRSMRALSREEAAALLGAAKGDRLEALYVLAVTLGLRQGELLALRWEDVDLRQGTLTVRHTQQELNGRLLVSEPKTAASRRTIPLPGRVKTALHEHRKRMLAEGLRSEWVFCDTRGGPLRRSNLTRRSFWPLLERAGLPRIRFHDLRHTAATLLLEQGVPLKTVQALLGHSTIAVTADTYAHVTPAMERQAVAAMDAILAEAGQA